MSAFNVKVTFHTAEIEKIISDPEVLRFAIGEALDNAGWQEEVDYTLEVTRDHNVATPMGVQP